MSLFGKGDGSRREEPEDAPRAPAAPLTTSKAPARETRPASTGGQMANIGKSISIKGDLTGNEDIVIEGKVQGRVDLPNNQLTVGANGEVQAEINAKAVVVVGKVTGNVHGTDRVEIQATGLVDGDVSAPKLVVAEGAVLNGAIQMTKKESAAARPSTPPAPAAAGGEARRAG